MTIEMTPLEELDFPTPDLTEAWEPTPAEVTAFTDWLDAESSYKTAMSEWVAAEMARYNRLSREYAELLMTSGERCYCSPSRGMMFDPWRYDIYNDIYRSSCGDVYCSSRGDALTRMNAELENQIAVIKAENARRAQYQAVERADTMRARCEVPPSRRWYQSIF